MRVTLLEANARAHSTNGSCLSHTSLGRLVNTVHDKDLERRDVLDPFHLHVLLQNYHVLAVVLVDELDLIHLLLFLLLALTVTQILYLRVFTPQVVDLLLEDIVYLLLVHFFLFLRGKADSSCELLHLTLNALSDCLA